MKRDFTLVESGGRMFFEEYLVRVDKRTGERFGKRLLGKFRSIVYVTDETAKKIRRKIRAARLRRLAAAKNRFSKGAKRKTSVSV